MRGLAQIDGDAAGRVDISRLLIDQPHLRENPTSANGKLALQPLQLGPVFPLELRHAEAILVLDTGLQQTL